MASEKDVFVLGAGFLGGQPKAGVEKGPAALRENGAILALERLGWTVQDGGDLSFDDIYDQTKEAPETPTAKNSACVSKCTERIYQKLYEGISKNPSTVALTLGGCHSVAIGTIAATAKKHPDLGVIWVDAHADINTPEGSVSGNIHGMPLAFLTGIAKHESFAWVPTCITPDRIVYVGLRDVDKHEKLTIKEKNILAFSMREVDELGIAEVMRRAIAHLSYEKDGRKVVRPIHLSYDVDGNDPDLCPSTGTRVVGGLTRREARYLCESAYATGKLVGVDIVEVNPDLGSPEEARKTARVGVSLVRSAFGKTLL